MVRATNLTRLSLLAAILSLAASSTAGEDAATIAHKESRSMSSFPPPNWVANRLADLRFAFEKSEMITQA
jgi:hypothetical protein